MALVDRVRNVCLNPASEWAVIEPENTPPSQLVVSYLVPLAVLDAVAGFIGSTLFAAMLPFGRTVVGGVVAGFVGACLGFVMTIIGCFVMAFIINALAPTFGGRQDSTQAFKVAVYSYTPVLVAGILRILPIIGTLVSIVAGFYSLYVLYLGLPVLMKSPRDKAVGYTVVVIVAAIVLWFVISMVLAVFAGLGLAGARMF
jgi:hypothetical protein